MTAPPKGPAEPRPAARPALSHGAEAALRTLFGARSPRPTREDARAHLEALAEVARRGDYFQLLGVGRACTADEARLAADALVASIERDLAPEVHGDPSLAPLLADVRQVTVDARDVLVDDGVRAAYREGLPPEHPPGLENHPPST